jgi:rubredoxin
MAKSYQICCPKCNNHQNFYRYGKDKYGNQKYLCRVCGYQFAPDNPATGKLGRPHIRSYPTCPVCGKAMFLHHDHKYYSNYQCCDKKCRFVKHIGQYGNVKIQKETTNEEDASAYY